MGFQTSKFAGDAAYSIRTTGDCVVGDEVAFERATFSGSYRNAKFAGFELIKSAIVADSYGADKQQHTFTIRLENGNKIKIKGRNLHSNGTYRKPWADEDARQEARHEKHMCADIARAARAERLEASLLSISFLISINGLLGLRKDHSSIFTQISSLKYPNR